MHFKLIYPNINNFGLSVGETLLLIKYGLEACGHVADIEKEFCPGYVNVVMEFFQEEFRQELENKLKAHPDTQLIIVATECLTGDTFNEMYFDDEENKQDISYYQRRSFWKSRHDQFMKIAPRCAAIWHLVSQQVDLFQAKLPNVPVQHLPHAYTKDFATVIHRPEREKDIDVLFTGTRTKYREDVLAALKDSGIKAYRSHGETAAFHREDLIARTKLCINIKQHPEWKIESNSRIYYHVCNDSLILTDQCEQPSDMHNYALHRELDWVEAVQQILDEKKYVERAVEIRQRFAQEWSADRLFPILLQNSELI